MHQRLRVETRALHALVERFSPFGPRIDRNAYVDHLARRLGFQIPIERALGLSISTGDAPLLRADLGFFGWSAGDLESLPICAELPNLGSFARTLGCAYVLDGARIGGRTIAPVVARKLGLRRRGVEFLAGGLLGDQADRRFAATLTAIERHAATLDDDGREQIVAGARDTFTVLARWLERGRISHD
jgi:heme oxygenase